MFDRRAATLIRPAVERIALVLVRMGVSANALTFSGLALGWSAAVSIVVGHPVVGAMLILTSRLLDALDSAVARRTSATDLGGFLDISQDFLFYASIPLAFAIADPTRNALPAAVLLASFMGTGTSFLAFAALAAKRGLTSTEYPSKSFYFLGGLTEATETLVLFLAMRFWPTCSQACAPSRS